MSSSQSSRVGSGPQNVDDRPSNTIATSMLLTDRSGQPEGGQLPSSIGTVEESVPLKRESRYRGLSSRALSWHADAPVELTLSQNEENTADVLPASARLVGKSSQQENNGSDGSKSSRIYPVASITEGVKSNRDGQSDRSSNGSNSDPSFAGRKLPLQKVNVTTRSIAGSNVLQQPHDPSIHRMIYFRTKKELNDFFVLPAVSLWSRRFNRIVFVMILLSIGDLAMETCDGPNLGSTDPGYPYLPGEGTHVVFDGIFAAFFAVEFVGRIVQTRSLQAVVRDPYMWLDFIGFSPWYILKLFQATGLDLEGTAAEHTLNLLRLVRTARLAYILRDYEQLKIMSLAIKASLRPLGITLFFLFTLVMIIATAIFYAEPCYNVETCTFTDIFNSAYFVMVTVATVGYGHQVPSLKNPWSVMLTMVAMILGQIYFSMPVAIIGNNFQLTYENFQMDKKKKARYLDSSLSPFDCQTLHSHAKRLCDIHYHFLNAWSVIHQNLIAITRTNAKTSQSWTMSQLESEAERHLKLKEVMNRLLEVHAEATMLLQVFIPHRRSSLQIETSSQSQGVLSNIYTKAKKAISKAKERSGHYAAVIDPRLASQTLRGRIWLVLEVPDSSRLATIVNQAMVTFAMISVMLFFSESLQELASSGVDTSGCKSVVKGYCKATGFYETAWRSFDPACFMRLDNVTSDFSKRLDFSCSVPTESPTCYGNGINFGSLNASAPVCEDAFLKNGVDLVCFRQQCRESVNMIFDMGPYWIYFEWFFGGVFSLELGLRFYISQDRKNFWRNVYVFFDVIAILPFFVEVLELLIGHVRPEYAIVATAPSFLSVIRVLKIMRILKLTRHFRGTKVLASTAKKVWKPLVIPFDAFSFVFEMVAAFFLFTGCIIAGAIFYEIERGKECFVGDVCMWWDKNVLTPELAVGLPLGKRILIQDKVKAIITDMIHSTWLSYATLTSVGYGDLVARTSIGKFFCIFVIITATTYSAMPISLVGTQFYSLYEKHMEKMVVKQGGSSISWRTKTTISIITQYRNFTPVKHPSARKPEYYSLSDEELLVAHEFESMRRTLLNVQKSLEAASNSALDGFQRKSSISSSKGSKTAASRRSIASTLRSFEGLDQSIEQKSFAIMDTLLQFSQVVERLQDAPVDYEAFVGAQNDLHAAIYPGGLSPRMAFGETNPPAGDRTRLCSVAGSLSVHQEVD